MKRLLAVTLVLVAMSAPALGESDGTGFATGPCTIPADAPVPGSGVVRRAGPAEVYPLAAGETSPAQAAVDAANPGDTILLEPGEYRETLHVRTSGLRIRGLDRDGVVFNGGNELEFGIDVVKTDRVVVENLTVRNYTDTGVFFWHVTGYWARFVTAFNNGKYGIYAFDSRCGQIDTSYGSGNADSAFYIGECFPCDAVITDILAEENALGYSGTNAGGGLILQDSVWRNNALGIVPNSLDGEDRPPQRGAIIRNNLVKDNNNKTAPGVNLAGMYWGVGIAIAGGSGNNVYGNTVIDHASSGIAITPLPDQNIWIPSGNTIWGNVVRHAPTFTNAMDLAQGAGSGTNNCWSDNHAETTAPMGLQDVWSCGLTATPPGGDARVEIGLIEGALGLNGRNQGDWKTWPAPTAPEASIPQPDDNGDGDLSNDGGVDSWLPALL